MTMNSKSGLSMFKRSSRYLGVEFKASITSAWVPPGSNLCFSFAPELVGYSAPRDLHRRAANSICESWFLIHQDVYHDLFVCF